MIRNVVIAVLGGIIVHCSKNNINLRIKTESIPLEQIQFHVWARFTLIHYTQYENQSQTATVVSILAIGCMILELLLF